MAELEVDIVEASPFWAGMDDGLTRALRAAAKAEGVGEGAVALFLADDVAVAALNKQFRAKDGPTNVLSFPPAPGGEEGFLGDIALAAETIAREAENQAKRIEEHDANLVGFFQCFAQQALLVDESVVSGQSEYERVAGCRESLEKRTLAPAHKRFVACMARIDQCGEFRRLNPSAVIPGDLGAVEQQHQCRCQADLGCKQ